LFSKFWYGMVCRPLCSSMTWFIWSVAIDCSGTVSCTVLSTTIISLLAVSHQLLEDTHRRCKYCNGGNIQHPYRHPSSCISRGPPPSLYPAKQGTFNMLAVASNLFSKPTTLSAYTLHTPSSSSANLPSTSSSVHAKPFNVGLWRVSGATHKTTGKDVSVWVFEKKVLDGIKGSNGKSAVEGKEWVLERLKKEVGYLALFGTSIKLI
jgi:hypothetical protein